MQKIIKDADIQQYQHPIPTRDFILSCIGTKPAATKELIKKLKLKTEEEKIGLKRRLNAMVRDGQLKQLKSKLYCQVPKRELVIGKVQATEKGFGFLLRNDTDDAYISYSQLRKIIPGDVVEARVVATKYHKQEAKLRKVLKPVTTLFCKVVIHEDEYDFYSLQGNKVTNLTFDTMPELTNNSLVKIQLQRNDELISKDYIKATVLNSIVDPLEIIKASILHKYDLPVNFSEAVLKQALNCQNISLPEQVSDLTHIPFITIDGADAKDLDDAVFCERTKQGFKLLVAIAHVSHYVKADSELDKEALNRGNSVYFPHAVIPMLPQEISNDLCSLNEKNSKLVLVCEMQLNQQGDFLQINYVEAIIKNHKQFTYNEVNKYFTHGKLSVNSEAIKHNLQNLSSLYEVLNAQRQQRQALNLEFPEPKIVFGEDETIVNLTNSVRGVANKLIEECMVKANVATATWLMQHNLPGLYRNHPKPADNKIEFLVGQLKQIGLSINSTNINEILAAIQTHKHHQVVQILILQAIDIAKYSKENLGHFGLGLSEYTHFTSPIRRYADLCVHRIITAKLRKLKTPECDLDDVAMQCSSKEKNAEAAERDFISWLKLEYGKKLVGKTVTAIITGLHEYGVYGYLDKYLLEIFVPVKNLPDGGYYIDEHKVLLTNDKHTFKFASEIKVKILNVNTNKMRIEAEYIC